MELLLFWGGEGCGDVVAVARQILVQYMYWRRVGSRVEGVCCAQRSSANRECFRMLSHAKHCDIRYTCFVVFVSLWIHMCRPRTEMAWPKNGKACASSSVIRRQRNGWSGINVYVPASCPLRSCAVYVSVAWWRRSRISVHYMVVAQMSPS